jgi:PAS domain S-box-containing protein
METPLTRAERAWLKSHPVIRLAPDPDFPPVEFFDRDGGYSGITADYVALMEKRLGIRFEIVHLRNWDEIIGKAKSREIDVFIAGQTPQRAEYMLFTRPFLEYPAAIISREKVKAPLTLEDLSGMKVSVVSRYATHDLISENHPHVRLDPVPDVRTGLRKVSFGLSDAFVENLATASYYIEKEGISNLRISGDSGYVYRMGFCSRKDWPDLNRILEKGVAGISIGEKKTIYKKWIPLEHRSLFTSRKFQTGLVATFTAILATAAAIIAWNRALARQVSQRTGELERELAERRRVEEELERARDELEKRVEERTRELAETVQTLRFTQFAIDNSNDQAFWMTSDGRFYYVNEAACRALGYSRDELVTMSVPDIDPTCPPEKVAHYWRVLREHGSDTFESCHRARDGSVYPVEIRSNLLVFDGNEYNCCFVTDITSRKRIENIIMARLRLLQFAGTHSLDELLEATLNEAETLTDSLIGFYHFLESDQRTLALQNWSTRTRAEFCKREGKGIHYDVSEAGVWADCIRERRPIVHNDYAALPHRKGTPPDHARVVRELVVPVFRGDAIVAILGVGNKPTDYTSEDMEAVSLLADLAWEITERKRADEALRESESRVRRKLESILDPAGDTRELDLADILDAPQIQALMDDLHSITGLKMSIIDLKGQVLADMGWQDICSKFHRTNPETLKNCIESDSDLAMGVHPGEFKTYRCKNNMWHLVTPIMIGGRHRGNLFMGQFFFENEKIDYDLFRSQARTYGFPEEEYLAALERVPRHSEETVNRGKSLFLRLTDMLSKLSYANIKLAHSLAERDRLTATLREANLVVENSPVVLFRCKPTHGWPVELVSRNVVQFGYEPEEFLSGKLTYASIVHPDDLEKIAAETEKVATAGGGQLLQEYRIFTKRGEIRWIIDETNWERNAEGEITHLEGVIIDITDRKLAVEALRQANLVAENSPVVLFRWKASDGWPVELVSANITQFDYTPDEFLSGAIPYSSIIHPDDRERVTREVHDLCDEGTDQFRLEYRIMTKGGDIRWVNEHSNVERDSEGNVNKFEGIVIDVTERKLAEEELKRQKQLLQELNDTLEKKIENEVRKSREKDIVLIQQNRQAALGEMLDHIAHQWKQPLNSISLIVQEMAYCSSDGELTDEHVQETIGKIMSLLEHMAQTIDVFRGFYRPDKQKRLFSIKESVDQALSFVAPAFRFQSIAVEIDVDPALTGFGYPKEYAQALLNILANARDIFRARKTAEPRLILRGFAEGSRSVVTITDNAGGIPEAVKERIFDFYFTTNEAGGSTGIGLYMSKNIVEKNMDGKLGAGNVDGGAQFRIVIPSA